MAIVEREYRFLSRPIESTSANTLDFRRSANRSAKSPVTDKLELNRSARGDSELQITRLISFRFWAIDFDVSDAAIGAFSAARLRRR